MTDNLSSSATELRANEFHATEVSVDYVDYVDRNWSYQGERGVEPEPLVRTRGNKQIRI